MYHVTLDDSVGLSDRAVVLHAVSAVGSGAVDSVYTDRLGRYRFVVPGADSSAEYFVSVEHDDIGYFSPALRLVPGEADTVPSIVVYDTSYVRPDIVLQDRHIIVRSVDVDGTRQVIELLALRNNGRLTRISADTSTPAWHGALPAGAFQLAVSESEVGAGAVYGRGNSLAVAAPIPPGEKQVLFSYVVPRGGASLEFPVDQPTVRLTVSLEDTAAAASGPGLALNGIEPVGGTVFKRFDAAGVPAGTVVSVRFGAPLLSVARLKYVVVLGATFALIATLTWWMRRNVGRPPA